MRTEINSSDRATFYLNALRLLRFAELRAPTKRRFGLDADALWKDFAGGLKTSDRIDILLRDADTEWPGAFGARATFGLRAVAQDDAFGADWASLPPGDGERVWKDALAAEIAGSVEAAIDRLCAAWELQPAAVQLPKVTPTTRLLVAGAGAIVAAIRLFANNPDLAWSVQVVVVADRPGERQVAAAAAMLLGSTSATALRGSDDHRADGKGPGYRGYVTAISPEASPEVSRAIEELAK